ncbi:MAG: cupin domain-containing protein [Dehalococcoidia bacterium]|nr:cupin domain-containing protein [Dehalococcoidia bacterium]
MGAIKAVRHGQRSTATAQTPGMAREAGVAPETTGSVALWMGFVSTPPGCASGVHHHGDCESGIYILRGRMRFLFGERLERSLDVQPGDFLYIEPGTVHQEVNLSATEPAEFIVARNCGGMLVVNVPDPREGR